MPEIICGACGAAGYVESIKCPYCTTIQPNKAISAWKHRIWSALFSTTALAASLFCVPRAVSKLVPATQTKPRPISPTIINVSPPQPITGRPSEFRDRLRTALEDARQNGAPSIPIEDLASKPEAYEGKLIVITGIPFAFSLKKEGDIATVSASPSAGVGPEVSVECSDLPLEARDRLFAASLPRFVVAITGIWRKSVTAMPNATIGWALHAGGIANIGRYQGSGALHIEDLLLGKSRPPRASMRVLLERALQDAARRGAKGVSVRELNSDRERFSGQRVALTGIVQRVDRSQSRTYVTSEYHGNSDGEVSIDVSALPSESREAILQLAPPPPQVVTVTGTVEPVRGATETMIRAESIFIIGRDAAYGPFIPQDVLDGRN